MRTVVAAFGLLSVGVAFADMDAQLEPARQAIEARLASSKTPGVIIGITDRQKLRAVVVHGYSDLKARIPLTPESRFAMGSISKAFTSIALLQLADEGRFDPHAPLARYLPAFKIHSPYAPMTGHDVLSHTSGLPSYLPDTASTRAVLLSLEDFTPTYAPGAHWLYSNTGFQIMGYALEQIEHAPYDAIIEERVLKPLGMTATSAIIDDAQRDHMSVSYERWPYDGSYVESPWFEYLAGDGSIVSTVADMAAYVRFFVNRGESGNKRLLSKRSYVALTTPVLDDYAYGLFVRRDNERTVISHGGSIAGFINHIEAHPDEGFGIVFLSNGGMDESLRAWVVQLVTAAFAGTPLPAAPPPDRDPLLTPLGDYVGHFQAVGEDNPGALDVTVVKDELLLKGAGGAQHLQRMGTDRFRAKANSQDDAGYIFARAEDRPQGAVIGVSHGSYWYTTAASAGSQTKTPAIYAAYVGHYVNNGPEGPVARVIVRAGKLFAVIDDGARSPLPLEPLTQDTFCLGAKDYSPERAKFDGIMDGHAQRLTLSGVPLYRRETP